jgi:hypothetical protein
MNELHGSTAFPLRHQSAPGRTVTAPPEYQRLRPSLYVGSVLLNGKLLTRGYNHHEEILASRELKFVMSTAHRSWVTGATERLFSMSTEAR